MTEPLTDLYLRDCRERLESSEYMDPIEWAERAPSLLGEIERLRAEADETTGLIAEARAESAAWAVEGAEMRVEVERLTGVIASLRSTAIAEAEAHAMVEKMLEAELGHVEPAEEPRVRVAGLGWICEVCCGPVEHNAEVAVWSERHRTVVAHAGACLAPDLWAAQCADDLSPSALAMIAVSEDNRRLRLGVTRRDAALDACADRIAETARAHREQHEIVVLQLSVLAARLDTLVASGAFVNGARRILDEVRADLRALATTKGTP